MEDNPKQKNPEPHKSKIRDSFLAKAKQYR